MNTINKAQEVFKTKYGIDCRVYKNKLYISAWNNDLSDTVDIEVSVHQIEYLSKQYNNIKQ
tara:strand:+ start:500 stop:682 length:183 start_codon:yes stop_codon:yes gene_type:complete